jgi:hypothetical protein
MAESEANATTSDAPNGALPRQRAILFIVFLGIVSLFGDMTYEGARSITGPYLGLLGVTATTIEAASASHQRPNSRERSRFCMPRDGPPRSLGERSGLK